MSGSKAKTPTSAATLTRAVENGSVCETAQPSTRNDTISAGCRQLRIADLLLRGEQNALPMKHLKEVTDLKSREIRTMIQHERLAGIPICANNLTGYYIAATDEERDRFIRSMRHRSAEIARVADALEQVAEV